MIEFKIEGLESLQQKLKSVSDETQYKGGRFALRKAAQVVRDAAREGASRLDDPETGRSISKNIAERWSGKAFKSTGDLMFRVGVLNGAKIEKTNKDTGSKGATPHWRLLEFGTEKMQARPFMRPALENNLQAATDEFVMQYNKAIDRAIKKGSK